MKNHYLNRDGGLIVMLHCLNKQSLTYGLEL